MVLSAQRSDAEVVGLANVANDMINTIKTTNQFQLTATKKMAATVLFITDVHALGLEAAKDMYATTAFYWDQNDATREWAKRFHERENRMPTQIHASAYSAVTSYLKAIEAAGTDDTNTVIKTMKSSPIHDFT